MLLADIAFVDHPELRIDEHESTQMPFRYMADEKGMPIMPDVSFFLVTLSSLLDEYRALRHARC